MVIRDALREQGVGALKKSSTFCDDAPAIMPGQVIRMERKRLPGGLGRDELGVIQQLEQTSRHHGVSLGYDFACVFAPELLRVSKDVLLVFGRDFFLPPQVCF